MGPQPRPSRFPPEVFRYSGLGCAFAAGVLLFTGVGWMIDRRFGIFPLATMVGALAGTALATLMVWQSLQEGLDGSSSDVEAPDE